MESTTYGNRRLARRGWACTLGLLLTSCSMTPRLEGDGPQVAMSLASERLAQEVEAWVAAGDLVGAELIVLQGDELLLHDAWGWADQEAGLRMQRGGVISVKSMTKPVIATAVLMLADDGALSLDDQLTRYLPMWAGDRRVTLRDLLAQTSGDGGGRGGGGYNVYDFDSLESWVVDWAENEPEGTYGEFAYSNFNYAALGYVVESVTGAPVEQFLEQRIFAPLGMRETWPRFAPGMEWAARVPARYRRNSDSGGQERFWTHDDLQPWSFFPGAFGLWMTGLDYAQFLRLWLDHGRRGDEVLLAPESIAEALSPRRSPGGELAPYGYGWFLDEGRTTDGQPISFRHGGGDGSVGMAFPGSDGIVLYLTQTQAPFHVEALYNQVCMSGLFEHPGPNMDWAVDHDVAEVQLDPDERARYVGAYRGEEGAGEGFVARVHERDGRLAMQVGEDGRRVHAWFHLVPLGGGRFAHGRYGERELLGIDPVAIVRFEESASKVTAIEFVSELGVEFRGLRIVPGPAGDAR